MKLKWRKDKEGTYYAKLNWHDFVYKVSWHGTRIGILWFAVVCWAHRCSWISKINTKSPELDFDEHGVFITAKEAKRACQKDFDDFMKGESK